MHWEMCWKTQAGVVSFNLFDPVSWDTYSGFHGRINQAKINSLVYCALFFFSFQTTSQDKLSLNVQLRKIRFCILTPGSTAVMKRTAVSMRMWTGWTVVTTTTRETSISDERQPQWSLRGEHDKPSGLLFLVFTCQSGSANSRDASLKLQTLLFFSSLPKTAQKGLVGTSV